MPSDMLCWTIIYNNCLLMGLLYALMIFELVDMFRFQLSFQLFTTGSILFLFNNLSMQGGAEEITVGILEGFSFFVNNYLVWFGNCVTLLKPSKVYKRSDTLFQISLLLFSTWREYFYIQPTNFSSQPNK